MVSRSDPKSVRVSPRRGGPPPWISWNSAGRVSAAVASRSIAAWALAAVWLNVCFSRGRPPTSIAAPRTSRMFPITEPTIDAFTTSWSPLFSAKKAMISSGAFPNVTFRRPPMPGPVLAAIASVASPITAAQGITPRAAAEEHQQRRCARHVERNRGRDEDAEVVNRSHAARSLRRSGRSAARSVTARATPDRFLVELGLLVLGRRVVVELGLVDSLELRFGDLAPVRRELGLEGLEQLVALGPRRPAARRRSAPSRRPRSPPC